MKLYTLKTKQKKHQKGILFIHGLMHAAWCWQKYYMPYFQEAGYNVYAIDLSNHGENSKEKSLKFTSISDYVQDIKEALENIEEECILIGHSMGGMIIQKYLENNTCDKVVLLTPVPPNGIIKTVLKTLVKSPFKFLLANLTLSLLPVLGNKKMTKWLFMGETMEQEVFEESFNKLEDESYFAFLGIIFPFLKKSKEKTKILIVGAEKDNAIAVSDIKATAEFHDATYHIFNNMAHDMMLEKEWQKPADFILEWLEME